MSRRCRQCNATVYCFSICDVGKGNNVLAVRLFDKIFDIHLKIDVSVVLKPFWFYLGNYAKRNN